MDYIVNGFKEADTPVEDHNKPWMVKLALRSVNKNLLNMWVMLVLGLVKLDHYNINGIISDRIKSDIDDIGSDQIGCGSRGDHGNWTAIQSSSPAASLDHDPGLAANAGLGDGVGGCPRPCRGFDLRGA